VPVVVTTDPRPTEQRYASLRLYCANRDAVGLHRLRWLSGDLPGNRHAEAGHGVEHRAGEVGYRKKADERRSVGTTIGNSQVCDYAHNHLVNSPIDAHIDPHHKGLTKANRSANNLASKQHMGGYKHGV